MNQDGAHNHAGGHAAPEFFGAGIAHKDRQEVEGDVSYKLNQGIQVAALRGQIQQLRTDQSFHQLDHAAADDTLATRTKHGPRSQPERTVKRKFHGSFYCLTELTSVNQTWIAFEEFLLNAYRISQKQPCENRAVLHQRQTEFFRRLTSFLFPGTEYFLHRLAFGKLVDEFVQISDFLHQRFFNLFDPHTTHDTGNLFPIGI